MQLAKVGTVSFVDAYGVGRMKSFTHVLSVPGSMPRKGPPPTIIDENAG